MIPMWKVREWFWHKFQYVTIWGNHIITNTFRQTGQVIPPKLLKHIELCSMKRNWLTQVVLSFKSFRCLAAKAWVQGYIFQVGRTLRENFSSWTWTLSGGVCKKWLSETGAISGNCYDLGTFSLWWLNQLACWQMCSAWNGVTCIPLTWPAEGFSRGSHMTFQ